MKRILAGVACGILVHSLVFAGDWNAFRGPQGNGISDEKKVPTTWGPEKNIKWKVKFPRPCNGSPIVSNGRVFVTCAQDAAGKERSLYCFDRKDGKQLWVRTVKYNQKMPTHKTNPYCATTPAANGKRVVVWHGSAGLFCYDFDGKQLWSKENGEFRHIWGYASSPVIYGDRVVQFFGPGKRIFLAMMELETGKTIWETEEPQQGQNRTRGAWGTPLITKVNGKDQIIFTMPTRVVGYDPADGKILWSCEGITGKRGKLAYSSPMVAGNLCVAIGGYSGPGVGIKLGGAGDITKSSRLWRSPQNPQSIGSGVFLGKYVFRSNASGAGIDCLDAESGKVVWKDRGAGSNWGSIVMAGGNLYVTGQNGTTVVFKPNPKQFEVVAMNKLGEHTNSTPAISDGQIFIRTFGHLYCIGE